MAESCGLSTLTESTSSGTRFTTCTYFGWEFRCGKHLTSHFSLLVYSYMRRIPLIQIIGIKHGRLTPFMEVEKKGKYRAFACHCKCGNEHTATLAGLRYGNVKSCGCLFREALAETNTTHGLRHTRIYSIWQGIKDRCLNKSCKRYADYGGRGITISDDWIDDPELFSKQISSEIGERPSRSHSLDRINNDKGYELGNLRWSTPTQQCNNTRRNVRKLTMNNKTQTVREWSEELGMSQFTIYKRMKRGLSDSESLEGGAKC